MSALAEPSARYRFAAGTAFGLFAVATVVQPPLPRFSG
jgi:hypothetical protein